MVMAVRGLLELPKTSVDALSACVAWKGSVYKTLRRKRRELVPRRIDAVGWCITCTPPAMCVEPS